MHIKDPIFTVSSHIFQYLPTFFEHREMAAAAHNAARTAFTAALGRIGMNAPTRAAIADNGFATILDLITVQDEDLDKLPKHLDSWRDPTGSQRSSSYPVRVLNQVEGHAILGSCATLYWDCFAFSERFHQRRLAGSSYSYEG